MLYDYFYSNTTFVGEGYAADVVVTGKGSHLQEDIVWEGIDGDSCEGFGLSCIVRLYNIP